jgi:hypothetical protein
MWLLTFQMLKEWSIEESEIQGYELSLPINENLVPVNQETV